MKVIILLICLLFVIEVKSSEPLQALNKNPKIIINIFGGDVPPYFQINQYNYILVNFETGKKIFGQEFVSNIFRSEKFFFIYKNDKKIFQVMLNNITTMSNIEKCVSFLDENENKNEMRIAIFCDPSSMEEYKKLYDKFQIGGSLQCLK